MRSLRHCISLNWNYLLCLYHPLLPTQCIKKIPPLSHKRQVECMKIIPLSLRFIPAQRDVMHEKHRSIHELERKTKEKTTVK